MRVNEGKKAKKEVRLNRLKDIIQEKCVKERILAVKMKLDDEETWTILMTYVW